VLGSIIGQDTGYPEVHRGFTYSLHANFRTVHRLGHRDFVSNPLEFIIHQLSYKKGKAIPVTGRGVP
jgi:hypothetical protein